MSSPCHTLSPHKTLLAKTKEPRECMEEEWHLISEGELDPVLSDDEYMAKMQDWEKKQRVEEEAECLAREEAANKVQEEVERKAEEERKAQEEAAKREREEREMAMQMAREAVEAWADAERRALEERLWDTAVQHSEMAVAPLWVAKPGRRMSVAGPSVPG
ncbi:hypothetical protein ID866_13241 [Astraeus odoratus]|nr:hypothetical protein ID866_13241 [Astraeus odoratus]